MPKVAAIVGIGPGLGSSLARKFSKEGYQVALIARNAEHLHPIEEEIAKSGGKAISIVSDACDEDSVSKAFDTVF
jgi:NADP-dependent 3-hydroxy acid dehydrogenase YdfG